MPIRSAVIWSVASASLFLLPGQVARAADLGGPPYEVLPPEGGPSVFELDGRDAGPRPRRRVTGGPGYVGSEWGLGKPSYYGIGPRPDWGRSSTD